MKSKKKRKKGKGKEDERERGRKIQAMNGTCNVYGFVGHRC